MERGLPALDSHYQWRSFLLTQKCFAIRLVLSESLPVRILPIKNMDGRWYDTRSEPHGPEKDHEFVDEIQVAVSEGPL